MKINLILIAPPAAGKGTQANLIAEKYKIVHISSNILKEAAKKADDLGKYIKETMSKGLLVKDEIVNKLMEDRISKSDCDKGYIIDGYPRTLEQAKAYDIMSSKLKRQLDGVLLLDLTRDEAMERALSRVICSQCGSIYNTSLANIDTCAKCNYPLEKRADDNKEVYLKRFDNYIDKTQPVIDYYQQKGLLHKVDANQEINLVFKDIEKIIENKDLLNDYH